MTAGTITFDIGGISPASLNLVSSDGLAPLPMPVSLEGQIEKFNKFMDGGAHERRSDISLGLAEIAQGLDIGRETVAPVTDVRHETIDASQVSRLASQDTRLASDVSRPAIASRPTPDSRLLPAADVPRVAEAPVAVEAPRAIETPVSRVALDPRVAETTVVRHETADEPDAVVRHEGIDASQVSRLAPQDTRLASDVSRPAIASRPHFYFLSYI